LLPTAILLFLAVAPLGFILPNAMAISMGQSGKNSGTASAILGVTTFFFGALVSPISGAGDPAVAMVIVMAVASIVSVALVFVLKYRVTLVED
jgi:DHA1 family bicyclomycin/chloramphenicol resistance-like MFS transporter